MKTFVKTWDRTHNHNNDWSRCEKLPLLCDFVGSTYRVFYIDRNVLPRKRTGNLEIPRNDKHNQLSDKIWISRWKNTETKAVVNDFFLDECAPQLISGSGLTSNHYNFVEIFILIQVNKVSCKECEESAGNDQNMIFCS